MSETKEIALIEREPVNGRLVTNIDELEAFVAERLVEYTPENYKGDADAAKKDRATLNTSKKLVQATRIDIVKRAMEKYGITELETKGKKVEKDIDVAALALDAIVKVRDEAERDVKRKQIDEFWKCQNFDLVPLARVFDDKWLSKGTKNKDIFAEIEKKIETIYSDIKTLDTLEDADVLKQLYLDTLDMGMAIRKGAELKAYREKLAAEAKERADREARKAIQDQQAELDHEEIDAQNNAPLAGLAAAAMGEEPDIDPIEEYTLRFKDRRSVLFALRQYMNTHGIKYTKL